MKAYGKNIEDVAKAFYSSSSKGLKSKQVEINRREFGVNEITPKKKKSFVKRLIDALSEPMLIILEFAWVITVGVNVGKQIKSGTGDFLECIGILVAVLLSAMLTLFMEGKSEKAFEMLGKVYDKISVKVIRDGEVKIIPKEQVVCGDLLVLEAGDKIIADGRVIESNNLSVDESVLTGESVRVNKVANITYSDNTPLAERKNTVYSGTFVGGGNGKIIVTAVGDNAELGKIAKELGDKKGVEAPLNQKLNKLGKTVTVIGGASAILVFLLSVFRLLLLKEFNFFSVQDSFLEAIVLIVAAVPEGLPTTAAISLTLNVVKLAKSNALIRKLVAAETAGCVSVICSDKTGTLTENKMKIEKFEFVSKESKRLIIENCLLNSTASFDKNNKKVYGSQTEGALLNWCYYNGYYKEKMLDNRLIGRVLPFDSAKKYMVSEILGEQNTVFIKGAPEVVVEKCNLTKEEKNLWLKRIEKYQLCGKRVIAFSSFKGSFSDFEGCERLSELDGFAVISDPVRKDVKKAVETCKSAGIDVMMMTGDNLATATSIALELGIIKTPSEAVMAEYIDKISDEKLKKVIKNVKVVARSTPATKLKIVEALKGIGEVVAVTGDGVNDAPAIERADIGIAMGSGSEITKEASDIVLLDDSFSTIVKAVSFGRNIYKNFQRFITFQLTVNLTAMIVVIVSLAMGMENPFSSVQLLWIDIIMDGPPALTLAMESDKGKFMRAKPVKRTDAILTKTMLFRILFQGVFMAVIILLEYTYDFLQVGIQAIPTAVFCIFVIFQLFNAFNCRKIGSESIFEGFADNKAMLLVFGATFLFQILITQCFCGFFATVPLSLLTWLKIIGVCLLAVLFSEIYKLFYRIMKAEKIYPLQKLKKLN